MSKQAKYICDITGRVKITSGSFPNSFQKLKVILADGYGVGHIHVLEEEVEDIVESGMRTGIVAAGIVNYGQLSDVGPVLAVRQSERDRTEITPVKNLDDDLVKDLNEAISRLGV